MQTPQLKASDMPMHKVEFLLEHGGSFGQMSPITHVGDRQPELNPSPAGKRPLP